MERGGDLDLDPGDGNRDLSVPRLLVSLRTPVKPIRRRLSRSLPGAEPADYGPQRAGRAGPPVRSAALRSCGSEAPAQPALGLRAERPRPAPDPEPARPPGAGARRAARPCPDAEEGGTCAVRRAPDRHACGAASTGSGCRGRAFMPRHQRRAPNSSAASATSPARTAQARAQGVELDQLPIVLICAAGTTIQLSRQPVIGKLLEAVHYHQPILGRGDVESSSTPRRPSSGRAAARETSSAMIQVPIAAAMLQAAPAARRAPTSSRSGCWAR